MIYGDAHRHTENECVKELLVRRLVMITWKRYEIACQYYSLIGSGIGISLVLKSVTLNDLERHNDR